MSNAANGIVPIHYFHPGGALQITKPRDIVIYTAEYLLLQVSIGGISCLYSSKCIATLFNVILSVTECATELLEVIHFMQFVKSFYILQCTHTQ